MEKLFEIVNIRINVDSQSTRELPPFVAKKTLACYRKILVSMLVHTGVKAFLRAARNNLTPEYQAAVDDFAWSQKTDEALCRAFEEARGRLEVDFVHSYLFKDNDRALAMLERILPLKYSPKAQSIVLTAKAQKGLLDDLRATNHAPKNVTFRLATVGLDKTVAKAVEVDGR